MEPAAGDSQRAEAGWESREKEGQEWTATWSFINCRFGETTGVADPHGRGLAGRGAVRQDAAGRAKSNGLGCVTVDVVWDFGWPLARDLE